MIGRLGIWHEPHGFFGEALLLQWYPSVSSVCVYIPLIIDVTEERWRLSWNIMEYPTLKQLNFIDYFWVPTAAGFALSFQEGKVFTGNELGVGFKHFLYFIPNLWEPFPCSYEWFNSFEASGCWATLHPVCFQGLENARKITKRCLLTRIAKVIKY